MIVDASVAVKWFLDEEGSDLAADLAHRDLLAPELIYAEVANALWKKRARGELNAAVEPIDRLDTLLLAAVPIAPLSLEAARLADDLRHPVYDCFYLALAVRENTVLVTADARFLGVCRANGFTLRVRALGDKG